MKTNSYNKSLFWHGLTGKFLEGLGGFMLILSLILLFIEWTIALVGIVLSFGLIYVGKCRRFDYQRQSGYIVHRGD